MDFPINKFKQGLREGRQLVGLWSSLSSAAATEILADSGFDWILIDTEHAPNEPPMVADQLRAASLGSAAPVVRPVWNDQVIIKRLLDVGVQTLLVPYVQSPEEAARAIASFYCAISKTDLLRVAWEVDKTPDLLGGVVWS